MLRDGLRSKISPLGTLALPWKAHRFHGVPCHQRSSALERATIEDPGFSTRHRFRSLSNHRNDVRRQIYSRGSKI